MDEVTDLLQAWGLPDLQTIFIKNEINLQALSTLSNEDIKELIPLIGPRALFLRCWKMWKADFTSITDNSLNLSADLNISLSNIDVQDIRTELTQEINTVPEAEQSQSAESINQNSASSSSRLNCTTDTYYLIENNELMQLLKENFETSSLINFIGKSLPNESARNLLASMICKKILKENRNTTITKDIYLKWSKNIKGIFPYERITTYYIPPCVTAQGTTHQARGKLVSQLLNLRRRYQKQGVLEIKEKRAQTSEHTSEKALLRPVLSSIKIHNIIDIEGDLAWLKSSSDPWNLVQSKWNGTLQNRFKDLRQREYCVEQYFKDYPALQKPHGYVLLVEDFNVSYPDHINNFYLNFPVVKKTLIELLKRKSVKDSYVNDIVNLAEDSGEENSNLGAILSLPELINPSIIILPAKAAASSSSSPPLIKKKKVKDNKWKPSKAESREAFVSHVQDDSYLKLVISKRHEKIIEKGFTPNHTL